MKRLHVWFIALLTPALLAACAAPASVDSMTVALPLYERPQNEALANNVAIRDVTGGRETNPMWTSQVSTQGFVRALEDSLRAAGFLAPRQAGRYTLTADILNIDQPFAGLDLTVTSTIRYILVERETGHTVLDTTLDASHTATIGDAFVAVTRLKLANEGAIRNNIRALLEELGRLHLEKGVTTVPSVGS